ncbi:hypothetical protein CXR25_13725 [Brevibacterium aurantiacum]|nr:hypothetical protein CXR25_13725 [Brevibacterium aurantiacum]
MPVRKRLDRSNPDGDVMSMSMAPAFTCNACHRVIGQDEGHNVTDDHRLICYPCLTTTPLHSRWYPQCPNGWHDMYDHIRYVSGNRTSTAMLLGCWHPGHSIPEAS